MELCEVKIMNLTQKAEADPGRYPMAACSLVQQQGSFLPLNENRESRGWGRRVAPRSPCSRHSKASRLESI